MPILRLPVRNMPVDGQTLKNGGIRAERGEYLEGRGKGGMGGGA